MPVTEKPKNLPEKKIGPYPGGIGVAIWRNTIQTDAGPREVRSISIAPRRYFDRETNEWKDAKSYRPVDLPALAFSLQKAMEYCYSEPLPDEKPEADESADEPRF